MLDTVGLDQGLDPLAVGRVQVGGGLVEQQGLGPAGPGPGPGPGAGAPRWRAGRPPSRGLSGSKPRSREERSSDRRRGSGRPPGRPTSRPPPGAGRRGGASRGRGWRSAGPPSSQTSPSWGSRSAMARSSRLLPEPEGPERKTSSPAASSRSTGSRPRGAHPFEAQTRPSAAAKHQVVDGVAEALAAALELGQGALRRPVAQ